ncbi:uncharacterized protein K441DRAFT_114456 [Cenococcum geophilum 1.58]|uniref:uncharacterized protein n=1 Tax=Cenococcum geophilum 1.58 TaxID=794803 RepID=UPI00358F940B|nr:hypothetical protein K441DRAFT_114456 [Cenococcum geophilum 1.58]
MPIFFRLLRLYSVLLVTLCCFLSAKAAQLPYLCLLFFFFNVIMWRHLSLPEVRRRHVLFWICRETWVSYLGYGLGVHIFSTL